MSVSMSELANEIIPTSDVILLLLHEAGLPNNRTRVSESYVNNGTDVLSCKVCALL